MDNSIFGKEPPEFQITFSLPISPVSLQTKGKRKRELKDLILSLTKPAGFLLSGDIKIEIEWFIHEQTRYESNKSPDIDNIVKPILDCLTGPQGIIVDDCQVQTITCYWIDWAIKSERINIKIEYLSDEWVSKDGLKFVLVKNNLCMPIHTNLGYDVIKIFLDTYEMMFNTRDKLLEHTKDYYSSNLVMSVQRVFHKSRLIGFEIIELNELRKLLID